jgi:2-dehydro-3-deoxygluconokinase
VTLGEVMVSLSADRVGPLRTARQLHVAAAGSEANVAIGVVRLGYPATWVSRLGADEFGELVRATLRGEGVTVCAAADPAAPTGLMVKERRTGDIGRVIYYRAGSAASRLSPADLPDGLIRAAGVLHVTGITPALSDSARQTVERAMALARDGGVPVSFDLNYRSALWPPERAAPVLRELAGRADLVFAGDDEAALLGLEGEPADLAAGLAALGSGHAVVKLGERGAVCCAGGELRRVDAVPVRAVDPVGAGDAFVAGYLAETLAGRPVAERLATAAACGAFAVTVPGDWEGLPTRADLTLLGRPDGTVVR